MHPQLSFGARIKYPVIDAARRPAAGNRKGDCQWPESRKLSLLATWRMEMSPQLNLCHSAMGARRIRWIFARSTLTRSRVLWRVSPTQAMQLVVAAGAGAAQLRPGVPPEPPVRRRRLGESPRPRSGNGRGRRVMPSETAVGSPARSGPLTRLPSPKGPGAASRPSCLSLTGSALSVFRSVGHYPVGGHGP